MPVFKSIAALAVLLVSLAGAYLAGAWLQLYGEHEGPGTPVRVRVPPTVVASRALTQTGAAQQLAVTHAKQILFGDLHVHTTFSSDAFVLSLPMVQGSGAHPIADACDYARFCSALDFWSINDHAEATTPQRWREAKDAVRQCNAIAGTDASNPDVAVFLGWEWSQMGRTPEDHYGHKNVIFKGLRDNEVPARPIGAAGMATDALRGGAMRMSPLIALADFANRQRYYNYIEFMREVRGVPTCPPDVNSRELPAGCYESAATPRELFDKLDQWGFDSIVIPHGNTWGFYSPPGTSWDKQVAPGMHDPAKQILVEIMSGHGNSEEYRDWQAVAYDAAGKPYCPEPRRNYLPSCWRAGEIIEGRCRAAGLEAAECAMRAAEARQNFVNAGGFGPMTVPGATTEEWLDAGQCKDCFTPAFNYRPGGSTQYALAIANFDNPQQPRRFRFGIVASSDNHRARPGNGYKEFDRLGTTEAAGAPDAVWQKRLSGSPEQPLPRSTVLDMNRLPRGLEGLEGERNASFFMTGGLVAVHANGRSRDEVWQALKRKEVYGTSGDRILLWFDLVNAPGPHGENTVVPMGGEVRLAQPPRFQVRAVGALKQKAGCPEYSTNALNTERLAWLCKGECYNPGDERKRIARIEVVRIRPQARAGEPVAPLIEDKWRTFPCAPSAAGCAVEFDDPDFVVSGRPAVYYVRAIEEPSPAVNGGNLRCTYDESGKCIEVRPCHGDYRTSATDDCLSPIEERAWSSPIFVDVP